ncbi:MAG: CPBP family intramembrane metalloprotease [Alphaproteobacteria bacterium]|nr:CPBP family intramembrane metalloprotease [Alphaproteobacteria bacterium]
MSGPAPGGLRPLLALEWLRLRRQPLVLALLLLSPVSFCGLLLVSGDHAVEALLDKDGAGEPDEDEEPPETLAIAGPEGLAAWLTPEDHLERVEGDIGDPEVLAELRFEDDGGALIRYHSSRRSREARDRLREVAKRWRDAEQAEAWAQAGLDITPEALLSVQEEDAAPPEAKGLTLIARALPSILVFICLINGLYMALDALSGERERGTLETLMVSAAPRRRVLLAKLLMVWAIVASSAALALLVLGLGGRFTQMGAISGVLSLGTLGLALPLTLLITTILGVCSAWMPDYRSSQVASLPLMIGLQVPAGLSFLPELELTPLLAALPIAGPCLALRDGLLGELSWGMGLWTWTCTAAWCGALMALGVRLVDREAVLFGDGGRGRRARGQLLPEALGVFAVGMAALFLLAAPAQALSPLWGMAFTQILLLGGLSLGALLWLGLPWARTLALRAPAPRDLGLAGVVGLSAWGLSMGVASLQGLFLPRSSLVEQSLGEAFMSAHSLPVALLAFALLPALFEEGLFRGALQGLLQRAVGPVARCLIVAGLFGLFHLDLRRILPTAALGLVLCVVRERSGSLWPPVLIHFLNNALMMVILYQFQGASDWLADAPAWGLLLPAALCLVALSRVSGRADLASSA